MAESFFWRKIIAKSGLGRLMPRLRLALAGGESYLPFLSDRLLAAPLEDLLDRALLPDINTPDSINFALGTPRCETFPNIPKHIVDRRPTPWGDLELRTTLAEEFRRRHGVEHHPADEVLITHGATGAFAAVLDALINPGDRVVLFDPTSPVFGIGLKHRRANIAWVPTVSDDGFIRFFSNDLVAAMRGAKMIVLADPGNPSGCIFAPEELEQIAFWAKKNDVLIVQDVSFDRWRSEIPTSRLANLPSVEGRILSLGSFAKSHGLTALRVGWLAGNRHLVKACAVSASLNAPFVSPLCQHVALQATRAGDSLSSSMREELNTRREYVADRLRGMGLLPWDSRGGFFFWVPVPPGETAREFSQRLLSETGVLVNPGDVFGPSGSRYFRISFATDEGRLREGLSRLEGLLRSVSSYSEHDYSLAPAKHAVQ